MSQFTENQREIIGQAQRKTAASSQFTVAPAPFHRHNGSDSPFIEFKNLRNRSYMLPFTLFGTQAATAGNYSVFFTAPFPITLSSATEAHVTAGSSGSAVTVDIEKLTGTTAPGSGILLTLTPISLKTTANTVQGASLIQNVNILQLLTGDRLALRLTGTPTAVADMCMTILFNY